MITLDLTCPCGARLTTTSRYAGDIARERRAFDEAHTVCRNRPPRPVGVGPSPSRPPLDSPATSEARAAPEPRHPEPVTATLEGTA